jgi:hypothetical protein
MSQMVREIQTPTPANSIPGLSKSPDTHREGSQKPQANWKGFVAGIFSGVAKLSGTTALLSLGYRDLMLTWGDCSGTSVGTTFYSPYHEYASGGIARVKR